jgi:hypothetical protein
MKNVLALSVAICVFVIGCKKPEKPDVTGPDEAATPEQVEDIAKEAVVTEAPDIDLPPLTNRMDWLVTASTQEDEFRPALAVDGDPQTRWSSVFSNAQWITVDLGKKQHLDSLRLVWEDAYARTYRVLTSLDRKNWETVYTENEGTGGREEFSFDPQLVRYVKIDLGERATKWGFSLCEIEFNPGEYVIAGAEVTASSGGGDGAPGRAVDGDTGTRWCSGFNDDEWWRIRFPSPRIIGGMRILWETAFAEKYDVMISMDGTDWRTVYTVEEGDGQTDLIFFEPIEAIYVKIQCRQRGTGWGNSIWEIDFYSGDDLPVPAADQQAENTTPVMAMDGKPDTAWHSEDAEPQSLTIALPTQLELGGISITWDNDYASEYDIEIDRGSGEWQTVYEKDRGNGGQDMLFFKAIPAERVRIRMHKSGTDKGYAIREIEFKSGEEQATPIRHYKAAAKDAPRGWFPRWLLREQEFWTVTGVIDDEQESLVGETGTIEPHKGDFCVMPFILEGHQLVTWNDVELEQSLSEDMLPMPIVRWKADGWQMDISAVAFGPVSQSMTAARYRFINRSGESFSGKLALAIRPVQLNPAWQHGGFSAIQNVTCSTQPPPAQVEINGVPRVVSLTAPTAMGAAPLADGDVVEFLARDGSLPPAMKSSEPEGKNSAGITYDLNIPAGAHQDIIVVYLLHNDSKIPEDMMADPEKGFEHTWKQQRTAWHELLHKFYIDIPDQRLVRMMKSNIAYILINKDGPWIKPGSRNYAHAWIRDGAMTSVTLLRMGLIEPIRKYIEAYTPLIADNGWAPFIILEDGNPVAFNANGHEGQEYDSQGQYAFLVRQYYDFSGDRKLVEQVYPEVVKVLEFGRARRRMRMTDEYRNDPEKKAYYGILPESNSHEGYFPAMHSYWDDFWMLRGLEDGAYLADELGHPEDARWMREEAADLRKCLLASIMAVMERDGLDHIPGCVEKGDFDATSTAIAIMACGENEMLPEPYKRNTFNRYFEDFSKGTVPGRERTFTPYEVRTADAFVRMGDREKALAMLRYFTENSVYPYGWNHMAEVVHARKRAPSYIGDMPHTWVGSGYINAVRSIFAYEDDGQIIVAAGVDPEWPAREDVQVDRLPTQYGTINYEIKQHPDMIAMDLDGKAEPPRGFAIPLPEAWQDLAVTVNDEPAEIDAKGRVLVDSIPAVILLKSNTAESENENP